MAEIRAIEARSVHQIQSGQVIVDLCSVAKELVENSLDAGATSIEIRFKNNGLDSIEVQDNGTGIAPTNFQSIALKHYTSKLSNYQDLDTLHTFGFRGEALSSLSALSHFSITTARAEDAPKGAKIEFERSGVVKSISTVACQKGTTAVVENIFDNLPVRQKELSKNIKREYGKVIGLLHAYACVCVDVKLTVKNAMPKAKSVVVFATQGNVTTRENIANVYGAKTLSALLALDLELDFQQSQTFTNRDGAASVKVIVRGHISKPVFGEGRQTPDRQMFFVNGRPCGLPQIAKAINEVYRSFNVSQSPFVFADLLMDTNAYDVNVSPDKRTILLHDSASLIENLKVRLTELFDQQDQTVPQSQFPASKLPNLRQLTMPRHDSTGSSLSETFSRTSVTPVDTGVHRNDTQNSATPGMDENVEQTSNGQNQTPESSREDGNKVAEPEISLEAQVNRSAASGKALHGLRTNDPDLDEHDDRRNMSDKDGNRSSCRSQVDSAADSPNRQTIQYPSNNTFASEREGNSATEGAIRSIAQEFHRDPPGIVQNTFDRARPKRALAEIATITIGDETVTKVIGSQLPTWRDSTAKKGHSLNTKLMHARPSQNPQTTDFSRTLRKFDAPGTQALVDRDVSVDRVSDDESGETAESENELVESTQARDETEDEQDDEEAEHLDDESGHSSSEQSSIMGDQDSDEDPAFMADADKKAAEEARVSELIRAAEASAQLPSKENLRRAAKALKGGQSKDSTVNLLTAIELSLGELEALLSRTQRTRLASEGDSADAEGVDAGPELDEESRLSLTVSKHDFAEMEIVGQFNLGFIITVRRGGREADGHDAPTALKDELFIVDQHASDEKFNFERLQAETVVGNQRLVRPGILDLTAVEEEVILENTRAMEANGFIVEIDTSGDAPVGRRCKLTSLPLSKEVVFDSRDLDELIHLLAESPGLGSESSIPRPSKVRKMFAMRACRSSVMIGKTLTKKQMTTVVRHMGTIDKPWNCPHGRPTMRHLTSLDALKTWQEGDERNDSQIFAQYMEE